MTPQGQMILYLVLMGILLVFSAFFSCADMVYSVAPIKRLRRKGGRAAISAAKLAEKYEETIVTVLFGNSLVNILASSFGAALSRVDLPLFSSDPDLAALLIELITLLTILLFGEILPKTIGKAYSFRLSMLFAPITRFFQILFFPFVKLATLIGGAFTRPLLKRVEEPVPAPSDEELQAMVDQIEEEGIIDEDQSELISSAIEFKETSAYEIMTPRVHIEGFEIGEDLEKWVRLGKLRHSRLPVYRKNMDNILGYLPLKDVQKALLRGEKLNVEELMLPILSVPGTLEISTILQRMKKSHRHIVLVKDEYGGTDGILTMEDILEELVGEMWDESEPIREEVTRLGKRNVYLVKGSMDIEEFFDRFHLDEEELDEDYETLSGFIVDRLGRFAEEGDSLKFGKVDIVVKKASPYTTEEAEVTYHPRRKVKGN